MEHRLTWLAIVLTFVLTIPGELAGYVAGYLYGMVLGALIGGGLPDLITGGWASIILVQVGSAVIQGFIGGWLGALLCAKVVKRADYRIVAYAVSALVVALSLIALAGAVAKAGVALSNLSIIANTVGVVAGLFLASEDALAQQRRTAGATVANPST